MDFDSEFKKIVAEQLKSIDSEVIEIDVPLAFISDVADVMSDSAMHFNRYLTMHLSEHRDQLDDISPAVVRQMFHAYELVSELSEAICDIVCGSPDDEDESDEDEES